MINEIVRQMHQEISEKSTTPKIHSEALNIFHDAYYEHRQLTGSYRTIGVGYEEKMIERYQFMFSKAMEYLVDQQLDKD